MEGAPAVFLCMKSSARYKDSFSAEALSNIRNHVFKYKEPGFVVDVPQLLACVRPILAFTL